MVTVGGSSPAVMAQTVESPYPEEYIKSIACYALLDEVTSELIAADTIPDLFINEFAFGSLSDWTSDCLEEIARPRGLERLFLILPFAATDMGHPSGLLRAVVSIEQTPGGPFSSQPRRSNSDYRFGTPVGEESGNGAAHDCD